MKIIDVTAATVEELGFFCFMSKRQSEGYRRKLDWLKSRFAEGLRIKMLTLPERGFIEYIPGEYAWRAVNAEGYMFIHCLWVVGKSKGRGFGGELLQECLRDAEKAGKKGVAMVTSDRVWLANDRLLKKHGFIVQEQYPPFKLMVKSFADAAPPSFAGGWDAKAAQFGDGLTIIRSDQCPYITDAAATVLETAKELGIPCKTVELSSSEDIRRMAPSPYGVFSIVYQGRLLSYYYMLPKDLKKALLDFNKNLDSTEET
ncbi:MAG: GNAT family N-acetyltransferase [Calditrichaeota bacterium]|nr:MAG: GNAT family N-acetyltransferase [Calditrichota bacterium]